MAKIEKRHRELAWLVTNTDDDGPPRIGSWAGDWVETGIDSANVMGPEIRAAQLIADFEESLKPAR